ncbi:MAG: aldo/keto reductase [Lachnospiraceae bacterium]|nr:aldo/keto reductase [Lachnospiraceae bacterium]
MEYINMQGIQIPPCMIGTWAWGGGVNGSKMVFGQSYDEEQLRNTFQCACNAGFTMWDTAEVYGMGNAEALLGAFIKNQDVLISTKHMPGKRFRPGAMEESLKASCERLEIDAPDLYWIHLPNQVEENVKAAIELLKAGKIKALGVSNYSLAQIQKADAMLQQEGFRLAAVQNHFSLLSRGKDQLEIIEWCKEQQVVYFSYMVLEQGALTGRYDEKHHFKTFSLRGLQFSKKKFRKIQKLLDYEKALGVKYQVDTSQIPIAWAIARHTVPIVGLTKEKHAEQLRTVLDVHLTEEELCRLETLAEESGVVIKGTWEPKHNR